jgi:hypothetical protein
LKSRKEQAKVVISSDEASQVIRNYILPMFEAKALSSRSSPSLYHTPRGLPSPRHLEPVTGSVYAELKLIADLSKELEATKATAKVLETKKIEAESEAKSATLELDMMRNKNLAMEKLLQMSRYQQELQQSDYKELQAQFNETQSQITEYKKLFKEGEAAGEHLKGRLSKLSTLQSKLQFENMTLENNNQVLKIENKILGERLSGLLKSFGVTGQLRLEEDLTAKVKQYRGYAVIAHDLMAEMDEQLIFFERESSAFKTKCATVVAFHSDSKKNASRLMMSMKNRLVAYETSFQKISEENVKLQGKVSAQEKAIKGLTGDYNKLAQKMKQNKIKRRLNGVQEQLCRHCNRIYLDQDNFNWSCRVHASDFGGEIWWCCGKTDTHALGCLLRKHESKDDEEGEVIIEEEEEEESHKLCSVRHKQSCTKQGHTAANCPIDPNPKGKVTNWVGEKLRLEKLMKRRNKMTSSSYLQTSGYEGIPDINTFNSSDSEDPGFLDLQSSKEELLTEFSPRQNRVELEAVLTKEEEELRRKDRTFAKSMKSEPSRRESRRG